MQNSFEKQVREKMDELLFDPAEPVWQNIEKQIRSKKERRKLMIWLPFLFMLLSGGAWWLLKEQPKENSYASAKQAPSSKQPLPVPSDDQLPPAADNSKAGSTPLPDQKDQPVNVPPSATINHLPEVQKQKSPPSRSAPILSSKKDQQPLPATPERQGNGSVLPSQPRETEAGEKRLQRTPEVETRSKEKQNAASDSTVKFKVAERGSDITNDLVFHKEQKNNVSRKWQFGVVAHGGISGVGKGFGSFSEEKALQDVFSGSPGAPAAQASPASPVRHGFSFSAGMAATRKVSKGLSLSAGLQYNYYSSVIKVGQILYQDSTVRFSQVVNQFYQNSGNRFNDYRNEYHFLALPLTVDWQILKRFPLQLHAGISLQRMISTNALLFDPGSRIYYSDNDGMNRNQVFSSFGLSYPVFKGSRNALLLGPQFQFSFSDLEKYGSRKHLFSAGIGARFLFYKRS